ncbi:MFS transporter [Leuconostocaceae bacterium ESL0723]|nr:MFS transporter [Leuconostocaceae bacterium ESL0723]
MDQTTQLAQRMDATRESPLFYKVFAMIAAGMILDGADVYLASAVNTDFVRDHFATLDQGSIFLSAGFLGLFFGSLLAGFIGDHYGRRTSYQINLLIFGGFTILAAFAPNIWALIVLRFIAAVGLGAEIVTGFSLINEFAPIKARGRWSAFVSVIANTAAPLTLLMSSWVIPHYSWRGTFIIVGVLALILWFIRHNFPESPRWLIDQGRFEEADRIIAEMESRDASETYQPEPEDYDHPVSKISIARGLLVATVTVSAINLVMYTFTSWMPTLLVKQGIEVAHSLTFSAVMMAGAPLGALIGAITVDRIGRKVVISTAFILAAILGLIYAQQWQVAPLLIIGFLLVTTLYVLMAAIVGVYMSELFPTYFRFRGTGIANAVAKILTVFTPTMAAWVLTHLNANYIFYFIAATAIIAAIVVIWFGPETKQRAID